MPAGRDHIAKWWRFTQDPDDYIGGSVPTGTVVKDRLTLRMEPIEPTMALLEQGLETRKLFRATLDYLAKDLEENDVLEIVAPAESFYLNKQYRVVSVSHASIRANDPRSQVNVVMERRETAHGNQFG